MALKVNGFLCFERLTKMCLQHHNESVERFPRTGRTLQNRLQENDSLEASSVVGSIHDRGRQQCCGRKHHSQVRDRPTRDVKP